MSIQIDPSIPPNGHVRLKVHGLQGKGEISCEAHLVWIKEKKWFIKEIDFHGQAPVEDECQES